MINLFSLDRIYHPATSVLRQLGGMALMFFSSIFYAFRRPWKLNYIFKQMEFIGVKSLGVVLITGTFTGMVLAIQTYYGFRKFGAEGLVGATVALSMTRELGPVLTSLMVTGKGRFCNSCRIRNNEGYRTDRCLNRYGLKPH